MQENAADTAAHYLMTPNNLAQNDVSLKKRGKN